MPLLSAGHLSDDTTSLLVAPPCALGRLAFLYSLDIGSDYGGIRGPLSKRLASGVAKESADFFHDFFVMYYFRGGFGGSGYAVSSRMLNRRPDESDGRQLTARDRRGRCHMPGKLHGENCNEHDPDRREVNSIVVELPNCLIFNSFQRKKQIHF